MGWAGLGWAPPGPRPPLEFPWRLCSTYPDKPEPVAGIETVRHVADDARDAVGGPSAFGDVGKNGRVRRAPPVLVVVGWLVGNVGCVDAAEFTGLHLDHRAGPQRSGLARATPTTGAAGQQITAAATHLHSERGHLLADWRADNLFDKPAAGGASEGWSPGESTLPAPAATALPANLLALVERNVGILGLVKPSVVVAAFVE